MNYDIIIAPKIKYSLLFFTLLSLWSCVGVIIKDRLEKPINKTFMSLNEKSKMQTYTESPHDRI